MRRYLTGLLCCGGAVVYLLFYTLESRGEPAALWRLRGAAPRALISSSHGNGFSTNAGSASTKVPDATFRLHGDDDECDVLLCGMSGVGKSTLLRNIKLGTVEHACYPVPREWDTCVAVWNFVAPRRRRTVRPAQVRGAIATARTLR